MDELDGPDGPEEPKVRSVTAGPPVPPVPPVPPAPRGPVGTVADEAARLMEALSGWAQTSPSGESAEQQAAASSDKRSESDDQREEPGGEHGTCAQCGAPVLGHASPAVAAVCRVCPVCQGVGLLSTLRPETLDRLVDVASAALVGLRTLAEQARAASGAAEGTPAGNPLEDLPVVDIPVVDEDATAGAQRADSRS